MQLAISSGPEEVFLCGARERRTRSAALGGPRTGRGEEFVDVLGWRGGGGGGFFDGGIDGVEDRSWARRALRRSRPEDAVELALCGLAFLFSLFRR